MVVTPHAAQLSKLGKPPRDRRSSDHEGGAGYKENAGLFTRASRLTRALRRSRASTEVGMDTVLGSRSSVAALPLSTFRYEVLSHSQPMEALANVLSRSPPSCLGAASSHKHYSIQDAQNCNWTP